MTSKRKAKKQARQQNNKPQQKPPNDKLENKPTVKEQKPQTKMVIGFAPRSEKSKIVHAICDLDNSTLCDIRVKNITPVEWMTVNSCTCKKCLAYAVVKQLKGIPKPKKVDKKPAPTETKPEPAPAPEPEKTETDTLLDDLTESLKNIITIRLRNLEKRMEKKLREFCKELLEKRPDFFIVRTSKDRFDIVHDPSRIVLCHNLSESSAEKMLIDLIKLPLKWDGINRIPKIWVTEVRKISEKYIQHEKTLYNEANTTPILKKRRKRYKKKPQPALRRRRSRN